MSQPSALSPQAREPRWTRCRPTRRARRAGRRRRHRRRRHGARRGHPRPLHRADRAARPRLGHQQPEQQADPRRPALPRDARLRAGPRGPGGARAAADPARPAPGPAGAVPLPAAPRLGAAVRRRRAGALRRDGDARQVRHGRAPAPAPVPPAGRPDRPRPAHRRRCPARSATTTARSTTPGWWSRSPGPPPPTAPTSPPAPRSPASCARASGWSASAPATSRPAASSRSAPGWWSTPPGVWTDEIQEMVGGRGCPRRPGQQGHPPGRAARPDPLRGRLHHPHREVRAVRDPVGAALDHRHHRHRLEPRQGAPGGQPRRTSTTSSTTSTRSCASRSTTTTSRACTPGSGRCCAARREPTSKISREHTVVTPVPGLVMIAGGKLTTYRVMAQGRDRRGRPLAADHGEHHRPRRRSPTGCRWSAPTASRPAPTSGSRWPGAPGLHVARIDHLLGRYGGLIDELLDLSRAPAGAGRAARRARRTTWPPRWSTPSPTRAPGTSTTSSPGVPGSPSRPSTAASTRPGRPPS